MRLANPKEGRRSTSGTAGEEMTGTTAAPAGANAKRTRSSKSSLDYKVRGSGMSAEEKPLMTTTKPGKRKNPQQQQQELEQQQQQQQLLNRRVQPSRARGSSGPPPRKWDLTDLEGLTEDELLQVLQEDPELAAAAQKAAQGPPTKAPTGAKKAHRDRYYRSKDGSVKDTAAVPNHMKELMDGGVPVIQWAILLVLLGAALFQLRSILGGASTTDKKTVPSTRAIAKGGKAAKKFKKKGATERTKKVEETPYVEKSVEETARLIETTSTTTTATTTTTSNQKKKTPGKKPTAALAKKQAPKKKKKVKANNGASLSKKEEQQEPDLVSTDGETDKAAASLNIPIHTESAEDDGDWQTVTKSGTAEPVAPPSKAKEKKPVALVEDPMPELTEEAYKEPVATKSKTANGSSETKPKPAEEKAAAFSTPSGLGANSDNPPSDFETVKSNKNKKKKKKPLTKPAEESELDSTENDEALALRLQMQEENLAKGETDSTKEVVWEEVSTKKKKGTKTA